MNLLLEGSSNMATIITNSFQQVVTDTLLTISGVAPVAITLFSCVIAWGYAKKIFNAIK